MKTILGIEIPEDLSTLSTEALSDLIGNLRDAALAAAKSEDGVSVETVAEIKAARDFISQGKAELATRAEAEAQLAADLEAAMADLEMSADPDENVSDSAAKEGATEGKVADGTHEDPEVAKADAKAKKLTEEAEKDKGASDAAAVTAAAWSPRTRRTAAEIAANAPETPAQNVSVAAAPLKVCAGVSGYRAGDQFANMAEVGTALLERYRDIAGGSAEKMSVARIDGRFPEESRLTEDLATNIDKLGGLDLNSPQARQSITAAMCAPAEPYYGLVGTSSTARPVAANLAKYVPARGAVTIYPSPKLADITGGTGLWTRANDANPAAVKAACATIACATPVQYDIYGIYRCMTIKNMLQMTYPELVEAYLNRLAALQARLAERTLLDAMIGSVNTKAITVAASAANFGAGISLWATLINAIAVFEEQERYDDGIVLDCWMPRWQLDALRVDFVRQRRLTGNAADRIPTDDDINQAFRNAGVNPIWTMDNATAWGSGIDAQQNAGALNGFPTTAHMLLSIPGNFRQLDRGDLQIGVTNNIMRDNTSLSKNEFTMFWESFEGLMDFGRVSWAVTISGFCLNGAQTADVAAMTCT